MLSRRDLPRNATALAALGLLAPLEPRRRFWQGYAPPAAAGRGARLTTTIIDEAAPLPHAHWDENGWYVSDWFDASMPSFEKIVVIGIAINADGQYTVHAFRPPPKPVEVGPLLILGPAVHP